MGGRGGGRGGRGGGNTDSYTWFGVQGFRASGCRASGLEGFRVQGSRGSGV